MRSAGLLLVSCLMVSADPPLPTMTCQALPTLDLRGLWT